jgi:hypothetical protein
MNRELFAGCYELLQEAPAGAAGRLFEARDTQTGEIVAVKVLKRELPSGAPERREIEQFFQLAAACQHPGIVRFHRLVLDQGFLVREWIHGFSFVDLLRRRREIPGAELPLLLGSVAETLDAAVDAGLIPTGDLLNRLFVAWPRTVTVEDLQKLRSVPLADWCGFSIKLNPASLGYLLPVCPDETMSTMVGPLTDLGPILAPSVAFSEMIYQLLGAPRRMDRARRFVPLATLNEAGNIVLQRLLETSPAPARCSEVWARLVEAAGLEARRPKAPAPPPATPPPLPKAGAQPPPLPAGHELRIPPLFMGQGRSGQVLRLMPEDPGFAPVHLIARPVFRIGRSMYQADFVARVLPESPENERLTKEIGRVHTVLEAKDGAITMRDGNGDQASINGSNYNGAPLAHDRPTPLTTRGTLRLYQNYELEIIPMLSVRDRGWKIINDSGASATGAEGGGLQGGVIFQPCRQQPALRQVAWIFSRVDFSISQRGDLVWQESGLPGNIAGFLRYRGQFWLAAWGSGSSVLGVNGNELLKSAVIPLCPGQALQIGPAVYRVEVE